MTISPNTGTTSTILHESNNILKISSRIPGPEVLLEPGKTDGQTKLVRRGTGVKCYSWSMAENTWNEIGDVMGANPASEGKTMYQGKVRYYLIIYFYLIFTSMKLGQLLMFDMSEITNFLLKALSLFDKSEITHFLFKTLSLFDKSVITNFFL